MAHESNRDPTPFPSETVALDVVRGILQACEKLNLARPEILLAMDVSESALDLVDGRTSQASFDRLWIHLAKHHEEAPIGLRIAERATYAADSWVAQLALLSPTLGDAIDALVRFFRLFSEGESLLARKVKGGVELEIVQRPLEQAAARALYEYALGNIVLFARHVVGGTLVPDRVTLCRRPNPDPIFQRVFGPHVQFSASRVAVLFRESDLIRASISSQPKLKQLVQERVERLADGLPSVGGMSRQVQHAVITLLPLGRATLVDVAKSCGVSDRTLQRRLRDEGTTFAMLLDEVRYALARDLLNRPETSIGAVAYQLGFSTHAAFHTAFLRWSGMTPGQFRS